MVNIKKLDLADFKSEDDFPSSAIEEEDSWQKEVLATKINEIIDAINKSKDFSYQKIF